MVTLKKGDIICLPDGRTARVTMLSGSAYVVPFEKRRDKRSGKLRTFTEAGFYISCNAEVEVIK